VTRDTEYQIYQTITGGRGWLFSKDSRIYADFRAQCDALGAIAVQYGLGMADDSDWVNGRRSSRPHKEELGAIQDLKNAALELDGGRIYRRADDVIEDVRAIASTGGGRGAAIDAIQGRVNRGQLS
jgi:hypothetical protein